MDENSPKVACVGAGYWGKNLVRNFDALGALAVICDADADRLAEFSEKYPQARPTLSFSDVLADPEVAAVALATPAERHYAQAKEALLAGKDVFVEKPLALELDQGRELVDLAEGQGRILMVGHILRYHPAVVKLKEIVDSGELGKVLYLYSNRLNLGKVRTEENILWSFAPHDLSVIAYLLGETPIRVSAFGGNYLRHDIADVTVTTMTFSGDVKAHVFVSWLHPDKQQTLVVVGSRKMAVFNDVLPDKKLTVHDKTIEWINRRPVPKQSEGVPVEIEDTEPLRAECAHFLECVADRRRPETDGREGLAVLSMLTAAQKSLGRGGAPVEVIAQEPPFFVHPTAVVDDGVRIGAGTKVWHFSHILRDSTLGERVNVGQNVVIGPNVTIGSGCKIQNNVSVYEGVTLEEEVFCGPSMVFTNVINPRAHVSRRHQFRPTRVGRRATIGANATILCGHDIGPHAFIGAGAVVTRDVPAFALMMGNPARQAGWMCGCGQRLGEDLICEACNGRYRVEGGGNLIEVRD
ncbi:MAG: Gfo/Idh/MocA family oxidoreductase [Proteobacteria bacterium]|nr:Gfo/Idh/MocA family oxidoreductase [Pseudomonadota bacterium]MBU1743002.1 Gfo/Idh/MocA family oxidoreductase [Pseudomonadota bacterium]